MPREIADIPLLGVFKVRLDGALSDHWNKMIFTGPFRAEVGRVWKPLYYRQFQKFPNSSILSSKISALTFVLRQ